MEIKYILSDLDGVIRKYPSERDTAIEQKYRLPSGAIYKTAFEKTILHQAVCGLITDEAWRLLIAESLATAIRDKTSAHAAIAEWSDFPGIIDYDYLKFIQEKFLYIPVAVLTNGTSRLMTDLTKLGVDRKFQRIFNSAEIGVCKPDKKIYQHVVSALNCQPGEILFIDDSMSHILGAEEVGLQVRHYRTLQNLRESL